MTAADSLLHWLQHEDPADTHPDVPHIEACHQLDAKAVADALPAIRREVREAVRERIAKLLRDYSDEIDREELEFDLASLFEHFEEDQW